MKCPLQHWWNKAFFLQHMCVQLSGWVRFHVAVGLASYMRAAGKNKSCKAYSSSDIPRIDTDKSKSQRCGSTPDISSAAWRHAVRGEMCARGKPQPPEWQTGGSRSCADGGCRCRVGINTFLLPVKQIWISHGQFQCCWSQGSSRCACSSGRIIMRSLIQDEDVSFLGKSDLLQWSWAQLRNDGLVWSCSGQCARPDDLQQSFPACVILWFGECLSALRPGT